LGFFSGCRDGFLKFIHIHGDVLPSRLLLLYYYQRVTVASWSYEASAPDLIPAASEKAGLAERLVAFLAEIAAMVGDVIGGRVVAITNDVGKLKKLSRQGQ
jgi:hypothetical protein